MNECRRKVQMSMMWKEANVRRRSPRISGLNACEGQQQMGRVKVDNNIKKSTAASADAAAVGRVKGPASLIRARKKRKLKPLQDVAVAATCVSPIAQESEDPDTNGVEDGENNLEYQPSNSDKPLSVHDDCHQDQPSSFPYALRMPEKRVLELILDVLQRKDTHEIFAEPVDPEEVEDYYEIIKEPMDFATMRAKLHEGMYTSLEQFEHDVFLISENAMHFNSSGTIYFRQARIINELSKRVFHSLKTDPDNFKFEFSETRRRTGRRPQIEVKGSVNSSNAKPASNFRSNGMAANVSSKTMPYSLSGAAILRSTQRNPESSGPAFTLTARDNEMLSGATGCRRTSFSETDRRSTYIPGSSFVNDSYSNVSSIYNPSKTLKHVNQQDMGYRESLILFVRDLGPTAQMVAKRKLHGRSTEGSNFQTSSSNCWFQPPKCHNPPAYASGPQLQTALDNNFGSVMSQNLSHQCHGHHTIPGNSSSRSWIDLCDSDKVGDRMDIFAASVEVEPNGEKKVPLAFKEDICTSTAIKDEDFSGSDRVHKSRNNVIMSGSNSSTTAARDLNFSVAGLKDKGSLSETMLSDQSMLDNQAESLKLSSDYSQSDLLKFSLRNNHSSTSWHLRTMSVSRSPQTNGTMSNLGSQCLIRDDQAIAAQCQSHRVSGLSGAIQHLPLASQFTFDLPYLKTRLDQINTSTRDKWLQPTGKSFLDKMSYQKLDNHQQSSLDSKHTDLLLQL